MKTIVKINFAATAPQFFYIVVSCQNEFGIVYSYSCNLITEQQYNDLRGGREQVFNNGFYEVILTQ